MIWLPKCTGMSFSGVPRRQSRVISIPRNENIANAFYLAGFIEAWGRGIEKIVTGMKKAEMSAPEFRTEFVTFHRKKEIIAMWNSKDGDHEVTTKVTTNQQVILNKLIESPEFTAAKLSEILGISLRKTKDNMRNLQEAGLIRHIGPIKGGHWEMIE